MGLQLQSSWENRLLAWAEEAFNTHTNEYILSTNDALLENAYQYCSAITRLHSRTFYMASGLLPLDKRKAARALYAFCRITDDIVDNVDNTEKRLHDLNIWKNTIKSHQPSEDQLVAVAWADTQQRFNIPNGYAEQLIQGVARDLEQHTYQTFDELAEYSYGVASTVGLMAMHIIGFKNEFALPYAVRLGVALQVTNILRDIGEDWQVGRVYLPQDELDAFGITHDELSSGKITEKWREFMRFQIERNRQLYAESLPGVTLLDPDGRFAIAAAAELYQAILNDIENNDYNVFDRRAHVSTIGKISRLPGIWWRSRLGNSI